jgi:hypothetical protein
MYITHFIFKMADSQSIGINLFHIFIVASLICSLAKNLQPSNDILQGVAYLFVTLMVTFHSYKIYKKISKPGI